MDALAEVGTARREYSSVLNKEATTDKHMERRALSGRTTCSRETFSLERNCL